MAYVKDIQQQGTKIIFIMSDCTEREIDLCVECPDVPIQDNPGDNPDPVITEFARCRVATHVGLFVANRLNDYLSGLNLDGYVPVNTEAYIASKIAAYGWSIAMYPALYGFTEDLYDGLSVGIGKDAKIDWDASSVEDIANAQETLYCALDETGEIDEPQRAQWAANIAALGNFEEVMSLFILTYPLDQLRQLAFDASVNPAAVDCEAFDCIVLSGCEPTLDLTTIYGAAQSGWSTALISYGAPPRDSRTFHTGDIEFTLPSELCITKVRVSHAGQSGSYWRKIQLLIDGNPYPVQNTRQTTVCDFTDNKTNWWILPEPVSGNVIRFVGADMNSGVTGNPAAPHVIFCIHVYHG